MAKAIGKMRFRIVLRKKKDAPDMLDGFSEEIGYCEVDTVWGNIESTAGSSYHTTRNISESATHVVTIRYNKNSSTMGENDYLTVKGRLFKILSAQIMEERDRFVVFSCEEMGEDCSYLNP